MLVALKDEERVHAWDVPAEGEYRCPVCGTPVVIKKGSVRIHHFAHRKDAKCPNRAGKSPTHYAIQHALFTASAHLPVENVTLERYFPKIERIADVYMEYGRNRLAFEVQVSPISIEEVTARIRDYREEGVTVIWVLYAPSRELTAQREGMFLHHLNPYSYTLHATEHHLLSLRSAEVFYVHDDDLSVFYSYTFAFHSEEGGHATIEKATRIPLAEMTLKNAGREVVVKEGTRYTPALVYRRRVRKRLQEIIPRPHCEGYTTGVARLVPRYLRHIRSEDYRLLSADFALEETYTSWYQGREVALNAVYGDEVIQRFWRTCVFHKFVHRKESVEAKDVIAFLRAHFRVSHSDLFTTVVGVLETWRKMGFLHREKVGKRIRYIPRIRTRGRFQDSAKG